MADKLIFPIGFDLEKAVKEAQGDADRLLRKLQTTISSKPLAVNIEIDKAGAGSINEITTRMRELVKQWNALTEAERVASKTSGEYTGKAKEILAEYTKLVGASESYARGLQQIASAARKSSEAQEKQLIKQREGWEKLRKTISAAEANIDAISAKLKAYQQRINGMEVGSAKFNKTALEIRRLTEELQRANQQMKDFQQTAFRGLSDSLTRNQVEGLTRLREQLRQIEADFNRLNQTGGAYNATGGLTSAANDILRQREAIIKQINQMLTTAGDAQIQREKEINRVIEQRKAKTQQANAENKARQDAYNARVRQGKEIQRILKAEENSIANITAKLQLQKQRLDAAQFGSSKFNKIAEEVKRLTAELEKADNKVKQLTGTTTTAAAKQSAAVRQVTNEFKNQDGYVSRLIKRLAVYAGFSAIGSFLTNVREVTAQFELQRVSLGAIIQDQQRANALFSEIKSFALKSPVSILDLTKYTKQLAAYKIGVDELFETTKKLTDVSVGLGVSMDRVVLAYGQTRATGYLRASEIRQFTEMGVPIVEELAAKLSKMNGELVTAAQVMDMVSKRAISFELVKEVFDDMTSAGGMFYNMQEKQGNTLFGLWAKLGDAASVMYDEIGNTDSVNSAMKGTIQLLTDLMKNWREVGRTMGAAAVGFAALWSVKKVKGWQSNIDAAKIAANEKYIASSNAYRAAIQAEQAARATATAEEYRAIAAKTASAEASYTAARAEYLAARNTTLWSKAWDKLKTAFLGNWMTLLIAGLAALGMHIYNAHEKANRLKNSLKEIAEESGIEQMKSVRNFESLANVAVNAADGSRKQKEALEELSRTYKDIIPQERLTIENLREMKGNYDSLTQSIKDYVAEQMKQKQVNTILEITGKEMIEKTREIQDIMKKTWSYEQIARFMSAYERIIRDNPAVTAAEAMKQAAEETGVGWQNMLSLGAITRDKLAASLRGFSSALKEQITQVGALDSAWNNNYAALGKYGNEYEKLANKIKENPISVGGSPDIDEDKTPYLFKQQQQNLEILQAMIPTLKKIMSDAGVVWQDGWANIVETIDKAQPQIISTIDFNAINKYLKDNLGLLTDEQRKAIGKLQNMYYNIDIPEEVVRYNRKIAIDLANNMSDALSKMGDGSRTALDNVTKYFMQSGASVNDYAKTLDDALKDLKARIAELEAVGLLMSPAARKELEDLKTAAEYVEKLRAAISTAVTSGTPRTSTADNRLSQLNEIEQTLTKINQKYEELLKKEGQTKALADIQKIYGDTLDYINKLGDKFGLVFEMPTDIKSLQDYRKAILKVIETLKMKGYEKAALELQTKIETGDVDQLSKQIEQKLKELSDKISRTKTAKEFYDRILSQTGDAEIAATLTMNVYGEGGEDLFNNTVKLLQEYFSGVEVDLPINFDTQQIDYKKLRQIWEADKALPKEMRKIPEAYDSAIKQILDSADTANQKMIEGWLKATEKAKTYGDKLADVYRTTATEIERIQKAMTSGQLDKGVGADLIAGYQRKQAEEIAKLQYEAFKDMPLYVQMFDDLDNASTSTLTNMRNRLIAMQGQWKNLDPTQLKELQSRLNEIDAQLARRNPFKTLSDSIKKYRELEAAHGSESKLNKEIDVATDAYLEAKAALQKQLEENPDDKEAVDNLKMRVNLSEDELQKLQEIAAAYKRVKDAIGLSVNELMQMLNWAGDVARAVADISEALGADEEDVQYWNDVADALSNIAGGIQDIVSAAMSINVVGIISSTLTAIPKMFVGFVNLFNAGRIRKANKEIKRQQELLDQLQYTYSRLEKAAEKLFGADYINNYNQQLRNLQAQAQAYRKQAEAEKSKGKKADNEKIKEYEEKIRDVKDEIADMQGKISEKMLGTDLASAARDFAKAWLDAYKEVGRAGAETSKAMKEKFQDMIENMVVEGALAAVMQRALQPMFKMIDEMNEQDFYSESFWKKVATTAAQGAEDADKGAQTLMKFLEQAGISIKDINTEYTGIKRDIAGASEETMSNVATIGNTLMYYVSPIPGIAANVALLTQHIINGNAGGTTSTTAAGWTDWQQQAMDHYAAIQRNTADTVVECRRAAQAAENAVAELQRVIKPRRTPATHSLHVTID